MIVFYNANIFAPKHPHATAVAIDHGCFIAIGSDAEILNGFSDAEKITDLQGKTLWPGLTDAHVHLEHLAESLAMIDCETATLDECLLRVQKTTNQLPQGAWVRGHGWNQNKWDSGFGTAEMLDSVTEDRPAYLTAKSLHASWANHRALSLAGIDQNTIDPSGGMIQRDAKGQPTGILFEASAMALVEEVIPQPTQTEITANIRNLIPGLWKLGLIGVHDFDGITCWKALQSLYQEKNFPLRIRKNIPLEHLDTFIAAGLQTDFGDDRLHLGGVKLFADGALGPQTAAMMNPYEGTNKIGNLLLSEDEITEIGMHAISHGFALTVHAIGDRANHVVLNAFERLRSFEMEHHHPHFLHRIEHVQIIDPKDLARLDELDIIASVQPVHAPSDMDMADTHLGDRARNAYAYRSMLNSGACVVLGSDAPVEPINPFQGIHAAVTRQRLDGSPSPEGWHPEQRLSLNQSLDGFSKTPARISQRDDRLGQISMGYKADFLILEQDPFRLDSHQLGIIHPVATFIEGACVYQSPNLSLDLDYS